jgi:hypothetical protein
MHAPLSGGHGFRRPEPSCQRSFEVDPGTGGEIGLRLRRGIPVVAISDGEPCGPSMIGEICSGADPSTPGAYGAGGPSIRVASGSRAS